MFICKYPCAILIFHGCARPTPQPFVFWGCFECEGDRCAELQALHLKYRAEDDKKEKSAALSLIWQGGCKMTAHRERMDRERERERKRDRQRER